MDVFCRKCGEPWDIYEVYHELGWELPDISVDRMLEDEVYQRKQHDRAQEWFRTKGCPSCWWGDKAPKQPPDHAEASGMIQDLCCDDLDGTATMLEDLGIHEGHQFGE